MNKKYATAFSGSWESGEALRHMTEEERIKVRGWLDAVDCRTCNDTDCKHRFKQSRIPEIAGGQSQCLRLASLLSSYSWRNSDGTVIIIPPEIVEAIKNG